MPRTYTNIAIDGGGASGYAYLGALAAVGDLKNVRRFMGISVGAIIAVLLAMEYTIGDIINIADRTPLREHMVPSLTDLWNARKNGGLLGNNKLTLLIDAHIETALGSKNATFLDLYTKFSREVIIVAANIRTHRPRYFCVQTDPHMPIRQAIGMSCAIPLVVQYRMYQGAEYYDGVFAEMGFLDYFDERGIADVLGITIVPRPIPTRRTGIMLVVHSLLSRAGRLRDPDARVISIDIPLESPGIRGFQEPGKMNGILYNKGYATALQYLVKRQAPR